MVVQLPSNKPTPFRVTNDTLTRIERLQFAYRVIEWFELVLAHLEPKQWEFAVDKKGKNLPAKKLDDQSPEHPLDFFYDHHAYDLKYKTKYWTVKLICPHDSIKTEDDLKLVRDRVHKSVSSLLMNLIGSAETNNQLRGLRQCFALKPFCIPDLFA